MLQLALNTGLQSRLLEELPSPRGLGPHPVNGNPRRGFADWALISFPYHEATMERERVAKSELEFRRWCLVVRDVYIIRTSV